MTTAIEYKTAEFKETEAEFFGGTTPEAQPVEARNAAPYVRFVDGSTIVMPVPPTAPDDGQVAGAFYGQFVHRWEYRDAHGAVCFYVYRFLNESGEKVIRQRTYWKAPDGTMAWHWRGCPAPSPLYGSELLAARANDPVIVCEGEKATDACRLLLPAAVAVTSAQGAQSPSKADWSAMAGRSVRIWPDLDKAGAGYSQSAAKLCHAAGARSIEVLNVEGAFGPQEVGWDAADAATSLGQDAVQNAWGIASNFTTWTPPIPDSTQAPIATTRVAPRKRVRKEERDGEDEGDETVIEQDLIGQDLPRSYRMDKSGLYYKKTRLGGPLLIAAILRDAEHAQYSIALSFHDRMGHLQTPIIPFAKFAKDSRDVLAELMDRGYQVSPHKEERQWLCDYLQLMDPVRSGTLVDEAGWHGSSYVMNDGEGTSFGPSDGEAFVLRSSSPTSRAIRAGNCEGWKERIAAKCIGNSRLGFAVSAAFAAPLVHLLGEESGGFNMRGASSIGKSVTLDVASSIFGVPKQQWRSTDNGLEGIARAHNDGLLCLDELGQIDPRAAGITAYMLANGQGKTRMRADAELKDPRRWRLLFLSSGETGLAQLAEEHDMQTHAGADLRMVDIPADAGAGLGAWENLHGVKSGEAFSRALVADAKLYRGAIGRAYIEMLALDPEGISKRAKEFRDQFMMGLSFTDADGQIGRIVLRFALVAAGGELATELGLTGWKWGEAIGAVTTCFKAWLAQRPGGSGKAELAKGLQRLKLFLLKNGSSKFESLDRDPASPVAPIIDRMGWREKEGQEIIYHITAEAWSSILRNSGCDPTLLFKDLAQRGLMPVDSEGKARKKRIKDHGAPRLYSVGSGIQAI